MPLARSSCTCLRSAALRSLTHDAASAHETPAAADPDPGRRAAGRLRPLPGEARRSATASTSRRRSSGTATTCSARAVRYRGPGERRWREAPLEPLGNDRWRGLVRGRRARPLAVRGRGVDRPRRDVARRAAPQGRGRAGRISRASSPRARRCSARDVDGRGGASPPTAARPARRGRARAELERRRRPRAGALRRLVRALPALVRRLRAASQKVLPRARRARLRRRLPAADPPDRHDEPQGPEQHAASRSRATPAARGRSAPTEGGHDAIHPELGTLRRLRRAGRGGARGRPRDRARLRDPVLARPPVAEGAPGVVQPPPRRDDQVRREPAEDATRTSTTSTSSPRTGAGSGRRCATSSSTGCAHGVTVFRVDNPHTKPVPFWEWLIAEVRARRPGRDLPRRGVHAAGDDDDAREGRLRPVLHVLHVEEHEGGARRVHGAARSRGRRSTGRTSSRTRRTSSTSTCRTAGRPAFEARLVLAATLSPTYGIYSATRRSRTCRCARAREEYLDSEKYEVKQRALDGPLLPLVARLNEIRRAEPALQRLDNMRLLETRERPAASPTRRTTSSCRRQPRSVRERTRGCAIDPGRARPAAGVRRARSAHRRARSAGAPAATTSGSARARRTSCKLETHVDGNPVAATADGTVTFVPQRSRRATSR